MRGDLIVFTLTEAEQWLAESIYPEAGIDPISLDWEKLSQASDMLEGVGGNAAFMVHEGRSDEEVIQYIKKYMMLSAEEEPKVLEFLKDLLGKPTSLRIITRSS